METILSKVFAILFAIMAVITFIGGYFYQANHQYFLMLFCVIVMIIIIQDIRATNKKNK